ncbi:MAG: hypothetical protein Q4F21_13180 [Lachnospiraceae bacterium]|nr:hypothetical protein [Lachnospiraceae bacterium]
MNQQIQNQLKNLDISRLRLANGRKLETELGNHARLLADCLKLELNNVYMDYAPVMYRRTKQLLDSIKVDVRTRFNRNGTKYELSVQVYFDQGSIHTGLDGLPADVEVLLNEGWQTHGAFQNVPYFGYREGTHYIEWGVYRYRKFEQTHFPIRLRIAGEERIFK